MNKGKFKKGIKKTSKSGTAEQDAENEEEKTPMK